MPPGVPVATVSIGGAKNAGLLAVEILAGSDQKLFDKYIAYKEKMAVESREKNNNPEFTELKNINMLKK
jgi:5-(carboxyamino)imidazole ribonucleotide mutase